MERRGENTEDAASSSRPDESMQSCHDAVRREVSGQRAGRIAKEGEREEELGLTYPWLLAPLTEPDPASRESDTLVSDVLSDE